MAKISILTSNATSTQPEDPSLKSDVWVKRVYRGQAYAAVCVIDFRPAIVARHVAFNSENTAPLSLAEVEVFGKLNLILLLFEH